MVKPSFAAACILAASLFLPSVRAQTTWDMPTGYPENNFHTENIRRFADEVDKKTGGKLKIAVHDNGSLFKANEIKRAIQKGEADIGEIFISGFSNEDPLFGVDSIPFVATGYPEAWRLWQAARAATEARLAAQGMKLLYAVAWPPQGLYSIRPVRDMGDLVGRKWRVYNPNTQRIAQLAGAQPVVIQASDLPQAMASGAVEVFISSSATGYDSEVWRYAKYYYDIAAWLPKNVVVVSKKAYGMLDRPTRDALLKAAAVAESRGWQESAERDAWYKAQLVRHGMRVEPGPGRLVADFKKIGADLANDWTIQTGAEGRAIIDAYRK